MTIPGVNDAEDMELTLQCMKNIKFKDAEIFYVLHVVAAIIQLGQVEFGVIQTKDGEVTGPL